MKRILGLDVSKSSVSCCLLTKTPEDIKNFFYSYPFKTLAANKEGIEQLLKFKADIAVLEPTGINYSKIWIHHLLNAGVEVRLVDHAKLRYYRERHLELPNKDDDADALALAMYGLEHINKFNKFLSTCPPESAKLRLLVLRIQHLNRVRSPIVNRIRQDLSWQFPEAALSQSTSTNKEPPLLWAYLAGEKSSSRYGNKYEHSIGIGLSDSTKLHAKRLCELHREVYDLEFQIRLELNDPIFERYIKVLSQFNFGSRVQALLISTIFPFQKYLENNRPIVKVRKGRTSGKPTTRHLSERKFLKSLGCAPTQEHSGDSKRSKVQGGSALCRKYLWLWVFSAIEPKARRTTEISKRLGAYLDKLKTNGKPVQLARSKTAALGVKLLFKALVKELCS